MKKVMSRSFSDLRTRRGFTLVETILAIALLVILSAIALPNIYGYVTRAQKGADTVELSNLNNATALYAADEKKSTSEVFAFAGSDSSKIDLLVSKGYLSAIPVPKEKGSNFAFVSITGTWILSEGKAAASDETAEGTSAAAETTISNVLYQSDFSSLDKIDIIKGSWQVINGILSPSKAGENRAILSGTNGTDYGISLTASLTGGKAGSAGYGIYYRASGEGADISGYSFQYDPGAGNRFVVKKVTDGKEEKSFQMVRMTDVMGKDFDITAEHDIQISVTGDQHVITVDGVQVMKFSDSTYTEGSVGVRSWSNSNVQISDVTVEKQ